MASQKPNGPSVTLSPSEPAGKTKGLAVFLGLLALAHVVATRLTWSDIPMQTDAGIWAYMGSRILEGARLYRDLWDQKPPGIYYTFALVEQLFGIGQDRGLLWLDAVVTVLVLGVTFLVARDFASTTASAAAVLILSILYGHRVLADWGCNAEKFVALFEMTGVWLIFRVVLHGQTRLLFVGAGLACGMAAVYKQTGILLLLSAALVLARDGSSTDRGAKTKTVLLLGAGFVTVWALLVGWLGATDCLRGFWQDAVVYDLLRAAPGAEGDRLMTPDHWSQVWESFKIVMVLFVPALLSLPTMASLQCKIGPEGQRRAALRLIAVYGFLTTLTIAVAPHGYGHFLLQAAPPAAVLAAMAFDRAVRGGASLTWKLVFAMGLIGGALPLGDHFRFTFDPNYVYRRAYARQRERMTALVGAVVERTEPEHSVLIWPPDDAASYYAGRRTPLEGSNMTVVYRGKMERLTPPMEELIGRLDAEPPDMIVDTTGVQLLPSMPGNASSEPVFMVEGGLSLAEDPDDKHPNAEGRILAPFKRWLRAHYGGQERVGDFCTIYFRGKPWREWQEYMPVESTVSSAHPTNKS